MLKLYDKVKLKINSDYVIHHPELLKFNYTVILISTEQIVFCLAPVEFNITKFKNPISDSLLDSLNLENCHKHCDILAFFENELEIIKPR